jgi:hypothetical protein
MIETYTFTCSICGEKSRAICVYCTKDTCANHICERCHRCVDCCVCDMPLTLAHEEEEQSLPADDPVAVEAPPPHVNGFGYGAEE